MSALKESTGAHIDSGENIFENGNKNNSLIMLNVTIAQVSSLGSSASYTFRIKQNPNLWLEHQVKYTSQTKKFNSVDLTQLPHNDHFAFIKKVFEEIIVSLDHHLYMLF